MRAALGIFVLVTALSISATAAAQQNIDLGKLEYEKGCVGCHGAGAQGSGVHTPRLTKDPPRPDCAGKGKRRVISDGKDIRSDRRARASATAWHP